MRKIRFKLLTQDAIEMIETDASTFNELAEVISSDIELESKINLGSVKFFDKTTKAEYGSVPEAVLPMTDILFIVTPVKTKSGIVEIIPEEELNEMGYRELRTYGSKLNHEQHAGIVLTGKRDDILESMLEYYDKLSQEPLEEELTKENIKQILIDSLALINSAINLIDELDISEELIGGVSKEELQAEADRLYKLLNN